MFAANRKDLGSSGGRRSPSSGFRWVIAEALAGHTRGMIVMVRSGSVSRAGFAAAAAAARNGPDAAAVAGVVAVEEVPAVWLPQAQGHRLTDY